MKKDKINILIADDHKIVRDGLSHILCMIDEFNVKYSVGNGQEVIEIYKSDKEIDVFIIDIEMPFINGLEVCEYILKREPECKIILFSTHSTPQYIEKAFDIGVKGYILKEDNPDNVIKAVKAVNSNEAYFSPKIANFVLKNYIGKQKEMLKNDKLTTREIEVLSHIADGKTNKDISDILCISVNTVNMHRRNLMEKLDLHNTAELVKYAIKNDIATL